MLELESNSMLAFGKGGITDLRSVVTIHLWAP
jgi:hypothetical protein